MSVACRGAWCRASRRKPAPAAVPQCMGTVRERWWDDPVLAVARIRGDNGVPRDCAARGSAMAETREIRVPDIGGYDDVPVIEVLVKAGDTVAKDQGVATLESDKATMEVPS